jgi:hypothetical protein
MNGPQEPGYGLSFVHVPQRYVDPCFTILNMSTDGYQFRVLFNIAIQK